MLDMKLCGYNICELCEYYTRIWFLFSLFSSSSSTTDICVAGNCMFYVQRVNLAVLKQKQKNEVCKYKPPDKIPIFSWEMKFVYR